MVLCFESENWHHVLLYRWVDDSSPELCVKLSPSGEARFKTNADIFYLHASSQMYSTMINLLIDFGFAATITSSVGVCWSQVQTTGTTSCFTSKRPFQQTRFFAKLLSAQSTSVHSTEKVCTHAFGSNVLCVVADGICKLDS